MVPVDGGHVEGRKVIIAIIFFSVTVSPEIFQRLWPNSGNLNSQFFKKQPHCFTVVGLYEDTFYHSEVYPIWQ